MTREEGTLHYVHELLGRLTHDEKVAVGVAVRELLRAKRKFPEWPTDLIHRAAIVTEESGELVRATLQHRYENGKASACVEEASHTAATALRFLGAAPFVAPAEFFQEVDKRIEMSGLDK